MSWNWTLAATLTFAASAHCAGMCGGFVLALSAPGLGTRLRRLGSSLLLQVGKASTYAFLGALAGSFGAGFSLRLPLAWGARVLAVVAGAGLVAAGLTLLGLRGRSGNGGVASRLAALWSEGVGPVLAARRPGAPLVVGMALGFLPCPLVYAGLAAAAATGSAAEGAVTLCGVALGTVPALTLVALLGSAWEPARRRALARAAGVLLLAAGVVTAARGLGPSFHHAHSAPAGAEEHAAHH